MARRYSVSGRFSQPDPYGGSYDFSDPQSLNRYADVGNDPVNRRDPSGLAMACTTPDGMSGWVGDDGKCHATVVSDTRAPILISPLSHSSIVGSISSRGYLSGTRDHGGDPGGLDPQTPSHGPAPGQTLSQAECDKKIAAIFGGPGAVAATVNEPSTLQHPSAGRDRYDHLAGNGVFHLYTNAQGTEGTVGLYAPSGFIGRPAIGTVYNGPNEPNPGEVNYNYERFTYPGGLQISFVHAGNPGVNRNERNALGSIRVGNIAGPGGAGAGYNHSHVNVYLNGKRVDPRSIFCK